MAIRTRVSQDRRNISRVMVRLDCNFTHEGTRHDAVIVDLSLKGAFLSSKFLPANGSAITIEMKPPAVPKSISFDGTVLRGTWVMSDYGKRGRFGVRFTGANLDLIRLISQYS